MCIFGMEEFCEKFAFDRVTGFLHPVSIVDHGIDGVLNSFHDFTIGNLDRIHLIKVTNSIIEEYKTHNDGLIFVLLTFAVHLYIRGSFECTESLDVIPSPISGTLISLGKELGLQPIASYATTTQFNIMPYSASTPDDDIQIIASATGMIDEIWFYKCAVFIERLAPEFISKVLNAYACIELNRVYDAVVHVNELVNIINLFIPKLKRIREQCNPDVFYNQIRKYLQGWSNDRTLPNGVDYEGFGRLMLPGATAGQSPLIQLVDIVLGVQHKSPIGQRMFNSVPGIDRAVLEHFKSIDSLRMRIILTQSPELVKIFNDGLLKGMFEFRTEHLNIVSQYILRPTHGKECVGTGGSDPVQILLEYRNETKLAKINLA